MKTFIKIAIILGILYIVALGGMATWTYYGFRDATERRLVVYQQSTTVELTEAILNDAFERGVPLVSENLNVRREGVRTWATASYIQPIELFPAHPIYAHPVRFSFMVESTNQLMVPPSRPRQLLLSPLGKEGQVP